MFYSAPKRRSSSVLLLAICCALCLALFTTSPPESVEVLNQTRSAKFALCFSLYGEEPRYIEGAVANAKLYRKVYPGWVMRVYHDDTVPREKLALLRRYGVELVDMTGSTLNPMNWRYLAASDPSIARYCFRDIDSRLIFREFSAVLEWLASSYSAHIIRDHPSHRFTFVRIPGGLWCGKHDLIPHMAEILDGYNRNRGYNADQVFLADVIWPMIDRNVLQHVSFDCGDNQGITSELMERVGLEHAGAVYIDGEMRQSDLELMKKALRLKSECRAIR